MTTNIVKKGSNFGNELEKYSGKCKNTYLPLSTKLVLQVEVTNPKQQLKIFDSLSLCKWTVISLEIQ